MKKKAKFVLGILGAIILGAIGSGLWELCIKKLFTLIGELIVDLVVSIRVSVLSDIYLQVSRGTVNRVIIENYSRLSFTLFLIMYLIAISLLLSFIFKKKTDLILNKLGVDVTKDEVKTKSLVIKKLPCKNLFKKLSIANMSELLLIAAIVVVMSGTYKATTLKYIESAIYQYEYLTTIISPYTEDIYIKEVNSKFYQISSKKEYDSLINELKDIAKKNGIKVREINTL